MKTKTTEKTNGISIAEKNQNYSENHIVNDSEDSANYHTEKKTQNQISNEVMIYSDEFNAAGRRMKKPVKMKSLFLSGEMIFENGGVRIADNTRDQSLYVFYKFVKKLREISDWDHVARIEVLRDMTSEYVKNNEDPNPAIQMLTEMSFVISECVHQWKMLDELHDDIENILASR